MEGFFIFKLERKDDGMNAQGWIRGYMAKSYDTHRFILHVVTTIERQLSLWKESSEINFFQDVRDENVYEIKIREGERFYTLSLNKSEASCLQTQSPFALDQYIWKTLVNEGLVIGETKGNYLTYCAI